MRSEFFGLETFGQGNVLGLETGTIDVGLT